LDQGKPFSICKKYDLAATAFTFKYYAGWADKFASKFLAGQPNEITYTKQEPFGVTAAIIPWNYPLMFIAWKAAPALAAGNVIIIKPSEKTPLSALYFAQIIQNILPPGVTLFY
jgi:aldehyde dehydrogenase (NAD+)